MNFTKAGRKVSILTFVSFLISYVVLFPSEKEKSDYLFEIIALFW